MTLIKPFKALRATPKHAQQVAAPPYDVFNSEEAREYAQNKPWSFVHVSKPEIDLPQDTDPHHDTVYQKGRDNLERLIEQGMLAQDETPCYYVYQMQIDQQTQTGIAVAASIDAYHQDKIHKHELTTPVKETDRVRHMQALRVNTGPVLTSYRQDPNIDARIAPYIKTPADVDVEADGGVRHRLWVIRDAQDIQAITDGFEAIGDLYIADGHHRSAASARVAEADPAQDYFLAVLFPDNELGTLGYHRVIKDTNGFSTQALLEQLSSNFTVKPLTTPVEPQQKYEYMMYTDGHWYQLNAKSIDIDKNDPVAVLDVSVFSQKIAQPIFDIHDPRLDPRIDFVGGARGLAGLQKRVDSGGMKVAFAFYPTSIKELIAVADANQLMPPKSTWFEPKLRDGLVSKVFE